MNYGYSILLSAFNREVSANGYLTQLGIFHSNMFNHFNLSSDLMEPFRILVDRAVHGMQLAAFDKSAKYALWRLLEKPVMIAGSKQTVLNTIKIYTRSIFDALNDGDVSLIHFYGVIEE